MVDRATFGVIGMGVMGRNLALNVERQDQSVAIYNRTAARTREFLRVEGAGRRIVAAETLESFVSTLAAPRRILVMVQAGSATDSVMQQLLPLLDPGDVVMDGGNAHPADTERRIRDAEARGLGYLGIGVSGGESGALSGPSLMAGGSEGAYHLVAPILTAIAARGPQGPCCEYFGPGAAGHVVKMVHNGIEYAVMEILAEAYDLMARSLGLSASQIADVLDEWNRSALGSYLIEITERILRQVDIETSQPLIDVILDEASQKGTGKWSTQAALDVGTPAPTIAAAVFARIASSLKAERIEAGRALKGPAYDAPPWNPEETLKDLRSAVYVAVIATYAQGLRQLKDYGVGRGHPLDGAEIARVWMDGCIIRSRLLKPIREAYLDQPDLPFLFLAEPFTTIWNEQQGGLRRTMAVARDGGVPVPALASTLDLIDAYRSPRLPANLIQAQRDLFGAHTYRRTDREGSFHTEW